MQKSEIEPIVDSMYNPDKKNCILVQRYLENPLLYQKRKFDLRCYCLIIKSPQKFSVFAYKYGYARTTSYEYVFDKAEDRLTDEVCEDSNEMAETKEGGIKTEEHQSPKQAQRKGSMPGAEQKTKAPREVNLMMHLTNEAVQVKSKPFLFLTKKTKTRLGSLSRETKSTTMSLRITSKMTPHLHQKMPHLSSTSCQKSK